MGQLVRLSHAVAVATAILTFPYFAFGQSNWGSAAPGPPIQYFGAMAQDPVHRQSARQGVTLVYDSQVLSK